MATSLKWQLSYAVGYMQLGMYDEAEAELALVDDAWQNSADVLAIAVELHHHTQKWASLRQASEALMQVSPGNPGAWVSCAYAVRRLDGLESARGVLLEGQARHPSEPTIKYNLGCYAAQLGELDTAEFYVRKAIELDPSFKKIAQSDADLQPLRDTGILFG